MAKKGYEEDGETLENYTGFTGNGFESFPALYHDGQRIHSVTEWPQDMLEGRINEYGAFLQRDRLMPRAQKAANHILDHLIFELAARDGVYDKPFNEDELCGNE